MPRRRRESKTLTSHRGNALDGLHEWLMSLPWVVERPYSLETPGVRCFGIACEALGRHQLWLISGLRPQVDVDGIGLAVIVPTDAAYDLEDLGWGRIVAPMPAGHALLALSADSMASRQELEAVVLIAYDCAMA